MATLSRARYFVARDDGTLAPLIAVDELSPSISIDGVPRTITYADTVGMTSLGYAIHPGCYLSLKNNASGALGSGGLDKSPETSVPAFAGNCIVSQLAIGQADHVPEENPVVSKEPNLSASEEQIVPMPSESSSATHEITQITAPSLEVSINFCLPFVE